MSTSPKKTGFSFGVILGAVIGTGAIILAHHEEGKSIKKKVIKQLENLKDKYPEQATQIEDVLSSALSEAKVLTKELKDLRNLGNNSPKKKTAKKTTKTFTRSGKPV